ncbi:peptidoglycan bridge formation protein FemAB, partial [Streptomyces sp. L7]
ALVLYRAFPGTGRSLAYLPDGPAIDWRSQRLERWLDPLLAHLEKKGAFSVCIGPPLVVRHWDAATVAAGVADPAVRHLRGSADGRDRRLRAGRGGPSRTSRLATLQGEREQRIRESGSPGTAAGSP